MELSQLLHDSTQWAMSAPNGGSTGALTRVIAGRISESGRHIVVLDAVAPFVKVYGETGELETAFLPQGGGPGEMKVPVALALKGDSLILVADAARKIALFDFRGQLISEAPFPDVVPLAISDFCNDVWVIYGPHIDVNRRVTNWLHELTWGEDGPNLKGFMEDSMPASPLGMGRPYGMIHGDNRITLRHEREHGSTIISWDCGSEPHVIGSIAPTKVRASELSRGGGVGKTVLPGSSFDLGIASVGTTVVTVTGVLKDDGEPTTRFIVQDGAETATTSVPGLFAVRDAQRGKGVLFDNIGGEVPTVFFVKDVNLAQTLAPLRGP